MVEELPILVKAKGVEKAKRDIAGIAKTVDKEGAQVAKRAATRDKRAVAGADRAPGAATARGIGIGGVAAGAAIGALVGGAINRSFSAFKTGISQSFDPNLTPIEKQVNVAAATLGAIPFIGDIGAEAFRARMQVRTGAAQTTAGQITSILGSAFRAIGARNPNATPGELGEKIDEQLGAQMKRLADIFGPMDIAGEVGAKRVAAISGAKLTEEKLGTETALALGVIAEKSGEVIKMLTSVGFWETFGAVLGNVIADIIADRLGTELGFLRTTNIPGKTD